MLVIDNFLLINLLKLIIMEEVFCLLIKFVFLGIVYLYFVVVDIVLILYILLLLLYRLFVGLLIKFGEVGVFCMKSCVGLMDGF